MVGFAQSSLVLHEFPSIPPHAPLILDDCALAFLLRIRTKSLWWLISVAKRNYKKHRIPKKKGARIIHAPEKHMLAILRRANARILDPLQEQLGAHVTAYRPGLGVRDAVLQHIPPCPICDATESTQTPKRHDCPRRGTCIKMDIKDFYPSTSRTLVRRYFKRLGYSHDVSSYLAALFTVTDLPNPAHNPNKKYNPDIPKFRTGVPQGAPTSGAICNLVANHRIDRRIFHVLASWNTKLELTGHYAWKYTRYSDDMTFTCGRELPPETRKEIIADLTAAVSKSGYRINHSKTRSTAGWRGQRYLLGMVFNDHPNYQRKRYRRLRAIVHNCSVSGLSTQFEKAGFEDVHTFQNWLRGTIGWVMQINSKRGQPLLDEYHQALELHPVTT